MPILGDLGSGHSADKMTSHGTQQGKSNIWRFNQSRMDRLKVMHLHSPFCSSLLPTTVEAKQKLLWYLLFGKWRTLAELADMTPQCLCHWKLSRAIINLHIFTRPGSCAEGECLCLHTLKVPNYNSKSPLRVLGVDSCYSFWLPHSRNLSYICGKFFSL